MYTPTHTNIYILIENMSLEQASADPEYLQWNEGTLCKTPLNNTMEFILAKLSYLNVIVIISKSYATNRHYFKTSVITLLPEQYVCFSDLLKKKNKISPYNYSQCSNI